MRSAQGGSLHDVMFQSLLRSLFHQLYYYINKSVSMKPLSLIGFEIIHLFYAIYSLEIVQIIENSVPITALTCLLVF